MSVSQLSPKFNTREPVSTLRPQLRVLLVARKLPPFIGGIETHTYHTYEVGCRMATHCHEVTILTGDPAGKLPSKENVSGMKMLHVAAYPKSSDAVLASIEPARLLSSSGQGCKRKGGRKNLADTRLDLTTIVPGDKGQTGSTNCSQGDKWGADRQRSQEPSSADSLNHGTE
jgi:hypothetical protein